MHNNEKIINLNISRSLEDFITSIYFGDISLKQAISRHEMERFWRDLEFYKPKTRGEIEFRK